MDFLQHFKTMGHIETNHAFQHMEQQFNLKNIFKRIVNSDICVGKFCAIAFKF